MRRLHWLPLIALWTAAAVSGGVLIAGELDENKVLAAVLQRFDENRNDKLEPIEARQARVRLRNLMEDKSERELNIFTWRDDVKELLQSLDQDGDNRLSATERDAATSMLERLIPQVDMSNPSSEAPRSRSTTTGSTS